MRESYTTCRTFSDKIGLDLISKFKSLVINDKNDFNKYQ